MPTISRTVFAAAIALALASCGAPRSDMPGVGTRASAADVKAEEERQARAHVKRQLELNDRLYSNSYDLLAAAVPFCEDRVKVDVGLNVQNPKWTDHRWVRPTREQLGIGIDEVVVYSVVPGSAAGQAGARAGDIILMVNGEEIEIANSWDHLPPWQDHNEVVVRRGPSRLTLQFGVDELCDYGVVLRPESYANAFADGRSIMFTEGLLDMLASDDASLQLVIGHEIVHNAYRHIDAKMANSLIGLMGDLALASAGINTGGALSDLGRIAWSHQFEHEADYVGLYIMARAGKDIDDAPELWRKFAARHGSSIYDYSHTHPTSPERAHAMTEALLEVKEKMATGAEILPNTR